MKNTKIKQQILILILTLSMLGTVFIASGCGYEHLTNEQHIERITQRVQDRFFAEGSNYPFTNFTVTILYSLAGHPDFFMVEFEPIGFFYGIIFRNEYYGLGEFVSSNRRSAFYIAGITNERRYLYRNFANKDYIFYHPKIRVGDDFIELLVDDFLLSTNNTQRVITRGSGLRISNLRLI